MRRLIIRRFSLFSKTWPSCTMTHPLPVSAEEKVNGVPHYDIEVLHKETEKELLRQLRPRWTQNDGRLKRWVLEGGYVNKTIAYMYKEKHFNAANQTKLVEKIVVRIQKGKDAIAKERAHRELRNIEELSAQNIIPELFCTFQNGYCSSFMEGRVCTPNDFRQKNMLHLSALLSARIHNIQLSDNYLKHFEMRSTLFDTLSTYIDSVPKRGYIKSVAPALELLKDEACLLEEMVARMGDLAISYCHNDLHSANLILADDALTCIDHEFGGPNYSAFDIANHFNEYCGIEVFDLKYYPKKEVQIWWIRQYLKELNNLRGLEMSVTRDDVEKLYDVVQLMSLVSHLLWSVWAFVPDHHADERFDYLGYGVSRFEAYSISREKVLNGVPIHPS